MPAKRSVGVPIKPQLQILEPVVSLPLEPSLEQLHIVEVYDWPSYSDPWHIDACKLERCSLMGLNLSRLRLWDSVGVRTDMSGAQLFQASMLRTELLGCRLSGLQCNEATLKDVQLTQSKLDMANFRAGRLERVTFTDCNLAEADFAGATLKDVRFVNCDLSRVTFDRAHCTRVDLTRSDISMLQGVMSLKGAQITHEQMIGLAPLLCAEVGFILAE